MNSRPPRMSRAPDELGGDEAAGLQRNRREVDVLASMMGADSQRIDDLVDDVGAIKGAVTNLHSGVGELKDGVNELRGGMIALTRLSINLERQAEDYGKTQTQMALMDGRLRVAETTLASELPPLKEARTWAVRGMLTVLGVVGLAVIGLVIVK
ncbi:MAG: hypothetical protein KA179_11000 [Sulfuritalea sp.]|nr:hypothetical protein [Sulfuritalea sp.]